jgi:hypothetical protein
MIGIYTAPIPTRLHMKSALIQKHPDPLFYLAQFDDRTLEEAFGWWSFPKVNFQIVKDENDDNNN